LYVESVGVVPEYQGKSIGTCLVAAANACIAGSGRVGLLATESPEFYERLRWKRWHGRSFSFDSQGNLAEAKPRGVILALAGHHQLDRFADISIEWRTGDVW
jgi:hypothetical protein